MNTHFSVLKYDHDHSVHIQSFIWLKAYCVLLCYPFSTYIIIINENFPQLTIIYILQIIKILFKEKVIIFFIKYSLKFFQIFFCQSPKFGHIENFNNFQMLIKECDPIYLIIENFCSNSKR